MSSAATTPNLQLPQWTAGEKPERPDFNAAFLAIDGVLPYGGSVTGSPDGYTASKCYQVADTAGAWGYPGSNYGVLIVHSTGYFVSQMYHTNGNIRHFRMKEAGTWTGWGT